MRLCTFRLPILMATSALARDMGDLFPPDFDTTRTLPPTTTLQNTADPDVFNKIDQILGCMLDEVPDCASATSTTSAHPVSPALITVWTTTVSHTALTVSLRTLSPDGYAMTMHNDANDGMYCWGDDTFPADLTCSGDGRIVAMTRDPIPSPTALVNSTDPSLHGPKKHHHDDDDDDGLKGWQLGLIIGLPVGIFLLLLLCCVPLCLKRRKAKKQKPTEMITTTTTQTSNALTPAVGETAGAASGAESAAGNGAGTIGRSAEEGRSRVRFGDTGAGAGAAGSAAGADTGATQGVADKVITSPATATTTPVAAHDGADYTGSEAVDMGSLRGRRRDRPEAM